MGKPREACIYNTVLYCTSSTPSIYVGRGEQVPTRGTTTAHFWGTSQPHPRAGVPNANKPRAGPVVSVDHQIEMQSTTTRIPGHTLLPLTVDQPIRPVHTPFLLVLTSYSHKVRHSLLRAQKLLSLDLIPDSAIRDLFPLFELIPDQALGGQFRTTRHVLLPLHSNRV